jgi:hypothetical protein
MISVDTERRRACRTKRSRDVDPLPDGREHHDHDARA